MATYPMAIVTARSTRIFKGLLTYLINLSKLLLVVIPSIRYYIISYSIIFGPEV
jgi:hypothetical protein